MKLSFVRPLLAALLLFCCTAGNCAGAAPAGDSPFNNFDDENEIDVNEKKINDMISSGRYDDAAKLSELNLTVVERVFGKRHGQYAKALNDLGWLMQSKGDYHRARQLYEQALEVEQARLRENDPKLATVYNNLAALVAFQGDFASAEPLYQKALKIQRSSLGENHPAVAGTLSNLALLMYNSNRRDEALALHEQALNILQTHLGENHPDVATQLGNVASAYQAQGKFDQALSMYHRALKIRETALSAEDPDVAQSLTSVALLTSLKNPVEAKSMLERALAIYSKALGENHPDLINTLNELGKLAWREGKREEAIDYFLRAGQITNRHIFTTLPGLSMAEQQAFLSQQVPEELSLLLSTCTDAQSLPKAYELVFKWKGCLIEGLSRQNALRRMTQDPKMSTQASQLADARKQLADWYYKAGSKSREAWLAREHELVKKKEAIERQIADMGALRGVAQDVLASYNLADWAKLLRNDEVIADIFRYQKLSKDRPRTDFYSCVILSPDGACRLVDLGPAAELDKAVHDWRKQVLVRNNATDEWSLLTQRLWNPIHSQLPASCKHLWLNPDAESSRLPWHLFPEAQTPLIAQIDSSRELAKLRTDAPDAMEAPYMVLAGGVHFGDDKTKSGAPKFPELPGSLKEAESVKSLAEKKNIAVKFLSGETPTKEKVVGAISNADWIHLATHGFFIDEREMSPARAPLLASGLVLAKPNGSSANQILTAEELVAADLHKARLVTLSACETGLGDTVTGQGVLGLRASIMAAGAKCVVMSLWKVPDDSTLLLMNRFYENLWTKNMPIAEALRAAQLSVRNEPYNRFKEPVHWAGWIAVGEAW